MQSQPVEEKTSRSSFMSGNYHIGALVSPNVVNTKQVWGNISVWKDALWVCLKIYAFLMEAAFLCASSVVNGDRVVIP